MSLHKYATHINTNDKDENLTLTQKMLKYDMALYWTLRHSVWDLKLDMTDDGFVAVDDILKLQKFKECTVQIINDVVSNDKAERFHLITRGDRSFVKVNRSYRKKSGNQSPLKNIHHVEQHL
jgi:RNA:NAD 2'-phosphotransferase (TPT1/KptA family)